jgi:hypothetical protein
MKAILMQRISDRERPMAADDAAFTKTIVFCSDESNDANALKGALQNF